jgi:hypothetical protein
MTAPLLCNSEVPRFRYESSLRTVQHADAVVGGDLQQEGVLRVDGAVAVVPHPHVAGGRGAQRLQPRLQQPPVRRHAGRQPDLDVVKDSRRSADMLWLGPQRVLQDDGSMQTFR